MIPDLLYPTVMFTAAQRYHVPNPEVTVMG